MVSFRTFRCPLFPKPSFSWFGLFLKQNGSSLFICFSLISGLATSNSIFIITMIADKSVPALFKALLCLDKKNHYTEPIVYPLCHAFYNISIYLITLMAFERYMCVCWPQKSKSIVTLKKTKIYIICCVFVGLIFTIPRLKSIQDLNFQ